MKEITIHSASNNIYQGVFLNSCNKSLFIYNSDAIDPKFPNIINAQFKEIIFKDIPWVILGKIPFLMRLWIKKVYIDKELLNL